MSPEPPVNGLSERLLPPRLLSGSYVRDAPARAVV